jgi:ketose-bisphosphate aldolase
MPLVSFQKLFADAREGRYALGYFESWNLESLQAVVEAAEEERAPVIAGFNGGFLRHHTRRKPESLVFYSSLRPALERSSAPAAFLLNESDDLAQIEEAMELGFNGVMPESEGVDPAKYRALVRDVVRIAHAKGVFVEAQVGQLPNAAHRQNGSGRITDPADARRFVEETGVDALAVAIGNIHILTEGKASMNFDALRRIREQVDVPLVLHGGTSIPLDRAAEMVELGVLKFNFGTTLKQAYLQALGEKLAAYHPPQSPHPFLGMGGPQDIMTGAREALKQTVKSILRTLNCSNKVRQ